MDIKDLEKLKTKIEENHQSSIATIDRVLEKMREAASRPVAVSQAPRLEERMSRIVERIITNYVGNFEVFDVARKYNEMTGKTASDHVRKEISNCINKLRHRNPAEIDVVEAGKGSRSGIYKMRAN
jgi:hypothetical protein